MKKIILLIIGMMILTGCVLQKVEVSGIAPVEDFPNSDSVDPVEVVDPYFTGDELFLSIINLDKEAVDSAKSHITIQNQLIVNSHSMIVDAERMAIASANSIVKVQEVIKKMSELSGNFEIHSDYTTLFSEVTPDTATPPFAINQTNLTTDSNDFIFIASKTRFFHPRQSVKFLFDNGTELGTAWTRTLQAYADGQLSGNLYLNIQKVGGDGSVVSVTNGLEILAGNVPSI